MKKVMFAAASVALIVGFAHAELLTNGDFEAPVNPVGTDERKIDIDTESGYITGWTLTGAAAGRKAAVLGANFNFWGQLPGLTDGQYVSFNGADGPFGDSIEQTFATPIGDTIDVSYLIGNGSFNTLDAAMQLDITSFGGSLGDLVSQTSTHGTVDGFTPFAAQFVATTAQTTIRFTDVSTGNSTSSDTLLDQVSVIPEPATLGMVAVFGGGLLFIRRKMMI